MWHGRFSFPQEHPVVKAEKLCVVPSLIAKRRREIFMGMLFFLSFSPSPLSTSFISWLHTLYLVNVFQTLQPWSSILWPRLRPTEFSRHWIKAPVSDPAVRRDPQSLGWGEESFEAKLSLENGCPKKPWGRTLCQEAGTNWLLNINFCRSIADIFSVLVHLLTSKPFTLIIPLGSWMARGQKTLLSSPTVQIDT